MSIKLYSGEVVFPPGQPFDGGYGPSINILVKMDDPAAPKVNERGETRIYKKLEDADSDYMYTLGKGDRVTMAWNEAGSKSHYSFVYDPATPAQGEPAPPPYSKPQDTGTGYVNKRLAPAQVTTPPRGIVVETQPPGNMEAWAYAVDYELDMYNRVLLGVRSTYQDLDDQAQHALAQRVHGWAHGWWRPGAVLTGADDEDYTRDEFLALVEANGGDARAWLVAASAALDAGDKDVLDVITRLGIQSGEWLRDDDGKWNLVQVVKDYWALANDGIDHGEIAVKLNQRFGVKLPAEAEPEPF